MKTKSNHGGKRQGAGRPKDRNRKIHVSMRLTQEQIETAKLAGKGNSSKGAGLILDAAKKNLQNNS